MAASDFEESDDDGGDGVASDKEEEDDTGEDDEEDEDDATDDETASELPPPDELIPRPELPPPSLILRNVELEQELRRYSVVVESESSVKQDSDTDDDEDAEEEEDDDDDEQADVQSPQLPPVPKFALPTESDEQVEEERKRREAAVKREKERQERLRQERERKEKERLEKERVEKERLAKQRAEKERLAKERAEKERLQRMEKERLQREQQQREKEEQEAREREERRLQEERRQEKERKRREAAERKERERQEREEREKREREEQEEREREEQERREREEHEAKEARKARKERWRKLKPDRKKIQSLLDKLRANEALLESLTASFGVGREGELEAEKNTLLAEIALREKAPPGESITDKEERLKQLRQLRDKFMENALQIRELEEKLEREAEQREEADAVAMATANLATQISAAQDALRDDTLSDDERAAQMALIASLRKQLAKNTAILEHLSALQRGERPPTPPSGSVTPADSDADDADVDADDDRNDEVPVSVEQAAKIHLSLETRSREIMGKLSEMRSADPDSRDEALEFELEDELERVTAYAERNHARMQPLVTREAARLEKAIEQTKESLREGNLDLYEKKKRRDKIARMTAVVNGIRPGGGATTRAGRSRTMTKSKSGPLGKPPSDVPVEIWAIASDVRRVVRLWQTPLPDVHDDGDDLGFSGSGGSSSAKARGDANGDSDSDSDGEQPADPALVAKKAEARRQRQEARNRERQRREQMEQERERLKLWAQSARNKVNEEKNTELERQRAAKRELAQRERQQAKQREEAIKAEKEREQQEARERAKQAQVPSIWKETERERSISNASNASLGGIAAARAFARKAAFNKRQSTGDLSQYVQNSNSSSSDPPAPGQESRDDKATGEDGVQQSGEDKASPNSRQSAVLATLDAKRVEAQRVREERRRLEQERKAEKEREAAQKREKIKWGTYTDRPTFR